MSEFGSSRELDSSRSNSDGESIQQYIEVGSNTFLGTKDGIKYALLPTTDNKFKLCEVSVDNSTSLSTSSSWSDPYQDDTKTENSMTSQTGYRIIKLISMKKEATPCRGQGDESGNTILSTPDSIFQIRNKDNSSISEKSSDLLNENQFHLNESSNLTYTTLLPRQEQRAENVEAVSYIVPGAYFQFPTPLRAPISTKQGKSAKSRQRVQLYSTPENPYPQCSPILHQRGRGHRQRRPKQLFYQYRGPIMHSTPTSASSSSFSTSSSSLSPIESISNPSISTCNESEESLEYPRAPNNTPISGEEDIENEHKIVNIQWAPPIQPRMLPLFSRNPREIHNEKERKRRLRIKNSCQSMKSSLPYDCNKTDNATVFENVVHFIAFMRETLGSDHDMEFMEQACIY